MVTSTFPLASDDDRAQALELKLRRVEMELRKYKVLFELSNVDTQLSSYRGLIQGMKWEASHACATANHDIIHHTLGYSHPCSTLIFWISPVTPISINDHY